MLFELLNITVQNWIENRKGLFKKRPKFLTQDLLKKPTKDKLVKSIVAY